MICFFPGEFLCKVPRAKHLRKIIATARRNHAERRFRAAPHQAVDDLVDRAVAAASNHERVLCFFCDR
jgi:hypothetical protein